MTKFQDSQYLKELQYAGANKLAARINLHNLYTVSYVDLHRWNFDLMLAAIDAHAKVLEIGAGRGDLWKKNAIPERRDLIADETEKVDHLRQQLKQTGELSGVFGRIPAGWNITLTDLSAGMLEDNKAHLGPELATRFQYAEADVQALPFEDASFDAIIANYMLYHVPDLDKAIAEIRRVLKPGGVLLAMTNGTRHMMEINQFVEKAGISSATETFGVMNVRLAFSLQNGAAALGKAFPSVTRLVFPTGLEITEVQPVLDYISSMLDNPDEVMSSSEGLALASLLEINLAENGVISISKETGVFIAR